MAGHSRRHRPGQRQAELELKLNQIRHLPHYTKCELNQSLPWDVASHLVAVLQPWMWELSARSVVSDGQSQHPGGWLRNADIEVWSLLCLEFSLAPTSFRVKTQVLPKAHKALHDLRLAQCHPASQYWSCESRFVTERA